MATQGFEIPTEFVDFAEKSVDQARNAFGSFVSSAVKTSEQLQTTTNSVQTTVHASIVKGLEDAQKNANATFDFASKLVKSKDLKEAYELQTEFVKSQFAALQEQAKAYGALAQKAAA